jgi:uncharacterized protein YjiS (DUF1127 family)
MSDLMMTRFVSVRPTAGRTDERRLFASARIALRTYLTRQALAELTARELADIGVSPLAAAAEAARLPWDTRPGPRGFGRGIPGAMQRALERFRTRRLISRLEARELRDIGVSPSDARAEASKAFWQV